VPGGDSGQPSVRQATPASPDLSAEPASAGVSASGVQPGPRTPAGSTQRRLTGWGRTNPSVAEVAEPADPAELAALLAAAPPRGVIARGLGRSYNNAAQNGGGRVIMTTRMNRITEFDTEAGLVTCEAGVSLEQLMTAALPRGWFVPVSPGTRQVTVGGAIAADVHGKNHHVAGSFARHVPSFDLLLADGRLRRVTPGADPELFWATAGGMGLTGIIAAATVRLTRVETSRVKVDTVRTPDIDETMAYLSRTDDSYDYTVAWSDCLARGGNLGRSVITSGSFAALIDLPPKDRRDPFAFRPGALASAPPVFPSGLVNRYTVALMNEAWYRKAPRRRMGEIQAIGPFFHPLDGIRNWNRVYGPAGFLQYQFVVPFGQEDTVRRSFEKISAARAPSFVTVLKRMGDGDPGLLSFPMPGWTLALDFPARTPGLAGLLGWLDAAVLDAGGRVYLAKDSRVPAEALAGMYPRLDEFRELRAKVDPGGIFSSDLSRRLSL
jgi:decaprenylphospho-beta-D-ribofuranose 2-oxidase